MEMKKGLLVLVCVLALVSCATTPNGDLLNSRIDEIEQEVMTTLDKVDPAIVFQDAPHGMRYDIDRNPILFRIINEAKSCGFKPGAELDRFLQERWMRLNRAIDVKVADINARRP
jgi:Tfp pilus assembly protein PilP